MNYWREGRGRRGRSLYDVCVCVLSPAVSHCYFQWLSVVSAASDWVLMWHHQTGLLMLISRLPTWERERSQDTKINNINNWQGKWLHIYIHWQPPAGRHTVYGHILGLPTNITIYNLYLSYTMIYCMNQQILLPITCFQILMKKNNNTNHVGIQVRSGRNNNIKYSFYT